MHLKFLGFNDSWKKGQPAFVSGYGSVEEGQTVDVPDELAAFLLTSERWVEGGEEASALQPEEVDPAVKSLSGDAFSGFPQAVGSQFSNDPVVSTLSAKDEYALLNGPAATGEATPDQTTPVVTGEAVPDQTTPDQITPDQGAK